MKTPTPNALMFAAAALLPAPVSGLHAADIAATPAGPGVSAANGVSLRPGKTADIKANPDGSFTLTKGVVLVTADGRPITLKNDGKDITITGGTYFIQAGRSGALTLVTLAGDATVAPAGGESFDIPEGHHTAVSPAGTHTEILAVDIAAMSRSSALLKDTNLPAKTRDAIATAASAQRDAIESGDLAPTRQLIVSASSSRGLGVASAQDVQAALNAANIPVRLELSEATGEPGTPPTEEPGAGEPPVTPSADPLNDYLKSMEHYYGPNLVFSADQSFTQDSDKNLNGLNVRNSSPVSISLTQISTASTAPTLNISALYDLTLTNATLSAPNLDISGYRSITLNDCAISAGFAYFTSGPTAVRGTGDFTATNTTFAISGSKVRLDVGGTVTLKNVTVTEGELQILAYQGADAVANNTRRVDIDGMTFTGGQYQSTPAISAHTINLKNVTFPNNGASLNSRDGVLNIGSSMDGAVNFIQNVKLGTTDLTTKDGINSSVKLGAGGLRYQGGSIDGTPLAGATGNPNGAVAIGKIGPAN